jgi:hypothetical protein
MTVTPTIRGRCFAIPAAIALGVVLILVLPFTPAGAGLMFHQTCQTGATIESVTLWTPWLVVDSPLGGSASGVANVTNPLGNIVSTGLFTASNGGAVAVFSLNNWTVQSQSSVWVLGPGVNQACSGEFQVSVDRVPIPRPISSASGFLAKVTLLGPGNASDAAQSPRITLNGYPSVIFGENFTNNDYFVDTCQGSGITTKVMVSLEAVGVPISIPGTGGVIALFIPTQAHYVYDYPGEPAGGVWYLELAPWGSYAFEWGTCPS